MANAMACENCGAQLSLQDMANPNCPYCKNVLKHHARAAEQAALVNQVLRDQIGAQYPGMPPGQIPQIGYQMGAGLNPGFQQFQQFQNYQVEQAVKRAGWITVVAVLVPVLVLLCVGVGMALWLFALR
jgi:hypothetical protein